MFFKYDLSLFPIVLIKFNHLEMNDANFDEFLDSWEHLYTFKKNFVLLFDTTNMSVPSIKYCFKMSFFIKKIRNYNPQYLNKSIIIVKNKKISNLLELIFYLQPPVAPIHITEDNMNDVLNTIDMENILSEDILKINIINVIKPNKPFLPFL